jgi:hypothetical protein
VEEKAEKIRGGEKFNISDLPRILIYWLEERRGNRIPVNSLLSLPAYSAILLQKLLLADSGNAASQEVIKENQEVADIIQDQLNGELK